MFGAMFAFFFCLCALLAGTSACWVLERREEQRRLRAHRLAQQRARQATEAAQIPTPTHPAVVVTAIHSRSMRRAG